jgi:NADH dehydrogenase
MGKIIIIGGGFAGQAAAQRLSRSLEPGEVVLIDQQKEFNFLPLLPDIIGRGLRLENLTGDLGILAEKSGFKFINQEVVSVDLDKREVKTKDQRLNYDYLIIASGSQTNFYGNDNIGEQAYKLDNALDAVRILDRLKQEDAWDTVVVVGGGYTGIEVAGNLWLNFKKIYRKKRIIILERAPSILGPLPEWMKRYIGDNLKSMGIQIWTNTFIERLEDRQVYLSNKEVLSNSLLIWVAGVRSADFIQDLNADKNPQGRIKVDKYLRLNSCCFVVGDAAFFPCRESFLRMAVQFSIMEGSYAAENILRSLSGKKLKEYRPKDLGFVIPMANNKSCGRVFNMDMKGKLPTLLHYLMCLNRITGIKNKFGLISDLLGIVNRN